MILNIKINKLIYILVISTFLANCSNRQIYNSIQTNWQLECQKLPPHEYHDCIKESSETYESYEKRRKEVEKP